MHENRIDDGIELAEKVLGDPEAPGQAVDFAAFAAGLNEVQRLLGTTDDLGAMIGLDKEWAKRAIMASGNSATSDTGAKALSAS